MQRIKDGYETVTALEEGLEEEFCLVCADKPFGNEIRHGTVFNLEMSSGAFA